MAQLVNLYWEYKPFRVGTNLGERCGCPRMGIEAINHEAISIYTVHIFYIYTYTKPCIGWKNQGYKTLRQLHTDPTIDFSGPLSPRRWGFLASTWILLEDDPTSKMKFQPIILKSTTFLLFSQMHQNALLANAGSEAFLFHTSSYYQHKHCTIKGNQSGNQVWSHQKWVVTFNLSTCGAVETGSGSGLRSPGCWVF